MMRLFTLTAAFLFSLILTSTFGQENFKTRPSPLAVTAIRYKDAYVKITYSQPQKKGREIFGKLVPFGEVWRLGANEATEITMTKDMLVNNVLVKAGSYSLFAIPQQEKWTIILNTELGLWGAYNYNPKLDLLRFDVPVQANDAFYEAFTLSFDEKNELANLLIMWDKTKVIIPVKFIN